MNELRGRYACVALFLLLAGSTCALAEGDSLTRRPFVIGIEDKLRVDVWNHPELSGSVTVRPDGMITVPLAGDILADALTPTQLSEALKGRLSEFVKDPVVTVIVEEINHYKIYVIGEINSQGVVQLTRPTRLLQVIAQSGGLTAYADKSNITIVRYDGESEVRIRVDYRKVLSGQTPEMNLELKPGDTIIAR
jgi:polysaccharide export outer membrane protein